MTATEKAAKAGETRSDTLPTQALATKEALHRLVDVLPDRALAEAARRLDELAASYDPQAQMLIDRWIRPHLHKRGPGDVVVAESYVPVYALIGYLPVAHGDIDEVAAAYDVSREAVEAALAYYRRHRAVIDARINTGESEDSGV